MAIRSLAAIALSIALAGCFKFSAKPSADAGPIDAGAIDSGVVAPDASTDVDSGPLEDGGGDVDSGVVDAGHVPLNHRPVSTPCPTGRPSVVPDGGFGDAGPNTCSSDSDCSDNAGNGDTNGRCVYDSVDKVPICTYDRCESDTDCGDAGVCQCGDTAVYGTNVCLPGDCFIDSDCGDGGYCSPMVGGCFPHIGFVAYYCHTPNDSCLNDSDCKFAGTYCVFDATDNHWLCGPGDCTG